MSSAIPEGALEIGRIGRPHGVRGDMYVDLITDRVERMAPGTRLWSDSGSLVIERSQQVGGRWLVHVEDVNDRDGAQRLTGTTLYALPIEDPDVVWVHDLIGGDVIDLEGVRHGRCVAVVANPAADLLELDSGALVPMTFVVDVGEDTITIDPPQGLFDHESV